jgi:hypothetical protein
MDQVKTLLFFLEKEVSPAFVLKAKSIKVQRFRRALLTSISVLW